MNRTAEIRAMLMAKRPAPKLQFKKSELLGTGSTLLNMACTGTPDGGFAKGEYVFLVGDSMSGKTWLSMSCLAEAARRKAFKDHRFINDNPEQGAKMDVAFYFGARVARRLETPTPSRSVQEFYYNATEAMEGGPCIYILDSMDALDDEADIDQFEKERKAFKEGKDVTGSYGTGKAKSNSQGIRRLTGLLEKSGSILIIISQTRDNIGFGAQFNPKTRSGGRALRFFAQMEIWSSVVKTLKKKVRGKDRQQGMSTKCAVKKNRHNGQLHTVEIPIYHSYGMDDVGSCIGYLIDEKHWSKSTATIDAPDFEFKGTEKQLVEHIEENDLEPVLQEIVSEVWTEIQAATQLGGRKRRYE